MTKLTVVRPVEQLTRDHADQGGGYILETRERERVGQLFAAAPELLEALTALLDWCREHTSPIQPNSPHELLVTSCAAIAAAAGVRVASEKVGGA